MIEPEDLPFGIQCASPEKGTPAKSDIPVLSEAEQTLQALRQSAGGNLEKYRFLLEQLAHCPSMGRKALSQLAAVQEILLTEQNIRTMMGHLERLGIVEIQRGRGGTHLTALGREVSALL